MRNHAERKHEGEKIVVKYHNEQYNFCISVCRVVENNLLACQTQKWGTNEWMLRFFFFFPFSFLQSKLKPIIIIIIIAIFRSFASFTFLSFSLKALLILQKVGCIKVLIKSHNVFFSATHLASL